MPGDFNKNNVVDAADYTVWRNSQGQNGIDLPADGSGNGTVGQEDFEIWKNNFQGDAAGLGASSQNVPEPTTLPLTIGAMLALLQRARCGLPGSTR